MLTTAFACGGGGGDKKDEGKTLSDTYILSSATLNGKSVASKFLAYRVEFKSDKTMRVNINYLGSMQTRNSTYSYVGDKITETHNSGSYEYTFDGDKLTTEFVDFEDVILITLEKEVIVDKQNVPVDFEGVLFGDDVDSCKIFNYCPAVVTEKDENGNDVMHIWYCTNKDDGVIMDHVGYRKGVKQADGKWLFSEQKIVLAPTYDTWDARHTCDPAVIKGEFKYNGETYTWLMSYLGCVTEDYDCNETGIAIANSPDGPWIKMDHLNPIVPWEDYGVNNVKNWGTGMPALVSLDQKGEVLLFYRSGNRGVGVQRWDFSNLNAENLAPKYTVTLTSNGITNSVGTKCNVGIPDFAYDPITKRFYVCSTTNEKNPADVTKTLVNSHCSVAYIENVESLEHLSEILQSGSYKWNMLGYVGPNTTGWNRNHNPALVRDIYGYIPDSTQIGVVVSTGHIDRSIENIFTYRLHGAYLSVN